MPQVMPDESRNSRGIILAFNIVIGDGPCMATHQLFPQKPAFRLTTAHLIGTLREPKHLFS